MNLKNLFLINSILALIFGLGFLIIPADVFKQYGVLMMPKAGIGIARLYGASLIGISILSWFAKDLKPGDGRRAIASALFIMDAISVIVSLMNRLNGVTNNLGWANVVMFGLLAAGFGYFTFVKKL